LKPLVKILSLLYVLSLALLPVSCDTDGNNYTGPWQEVPTPGVGGNLEACYFNSPDDGWACGSEGDRPYMVLIHWNGNEWERYEYPGWFEDEEYIHISLFDIAFSSPDCGWCVGSVMYKATGEDRGAGFILRYDGNEWYVFTEHLGEQVDNVFAVSDNGVWFSCWEPYGGDEGSDLFHWNGSELEYYDLNPGNYGISALAFGSANDGLAVGRYKVIYHWDGSSWEQIYYGLGGELDGVAYSTPSTAWIVGNYPYNIFRWDNGELTWEHHKNCWYEDVHFSSPDEGCMYGVEATEQYPDGHGFTWHWDGVGWTRVDIPEDMGGWDIFSIDNENAWVVGEHNAYTPYCSSWRYISN